MEKKIKIKTPKLLDYQKEVYDNLISNWNDTIHIVKSPRQFGKSIFCELILLYASINKKKTTSIVCEPTLNQSRKVAKEIYNMVKGIPIFKNFNSSLLEINFNNGSEILFKSSEQGEEAIRGYTVNGILIFDEGAYINDNFFYASMALTQAHKSPILIFSTPRYKSGFFYDFFIKGEQKTKNVFSYDWGKFKNPFLSDEKLELIKKTMPFNLFKADYLCQWMDSSSDVFGDFNKVFSDEVILDGNYVGAIDWGVGKNAKSKDSDYTAISLFNNDRQQVFVERWNDLNETQTIDKIITILKKWKPKKIVIETNSIGSVYLGLLKNAMVKNNILTVILPINLTNKIKFDIYSEFIVAVQNRTIQLKNNSETKLEMSSLQMEKTKSGLTTFNAANNYHDDILITICYSLYAMKKGQYIVK